MDHGIEIERQHPHGPAADRPRTCDLPLLATNDLHYTHAEDAEAHEVLLCVQTGKTLADPNRFRFDAPDFYLKSAAGDARAVGGELPEACDNTLLVAERCDVDVHRGPEPDAPVPGARGRDRGVLAGQGGRAGPAASGSRTASRSDHRDAGRRTRSASSARWASPGYFLVTADLVAHAKSQSASGSVRAAGRPPAALIAYALGITELDPIAARPAVRAVPQPRAHLDARHRHRLRRAPARRDDPLRHREVRRGARRPDRHLLDDQGQGRDQGLRAGARPARSRWATGSPRRCRPAVMGKDIPLAGHLRPGAQALQGGRRLPRALRVRRARSSEVIDTARGLEGLSGSGACTRPA